MISPDQRVTLGGAVERRATPKLYAVPRHDEVAGTGARNNDCTIGNNVVDTNGNNVVDTTDNNVVPTDDEVANDGTPVNDEPRNADAPAFVGPRIVWAPRPDVCGPHNRIVVVRKGTLFDFEPAATTNDGTTLYSLTIIPLHAMLSPPRSGDTGC